MVVANFNVASGIVNTTFTVQSSQLSFPAITNGAAKASAEILVTDSLNFGDRGQISLTGLESGANSFATRFNSNSLSFVNLIPGNSYSGAAGITHNYTGMNASFPAYDSVPSVVTNMQSEFSFTLSKFDHAGGTSFFEIIPAPGTAVLLGLGGLTVSRRRRIR